jgi:hypothetical protein
LGKLVGLGSNSHCRCPGKAARDRWQWRCSALRRLARLQRQRDRGWSPA